MTKHARRSIVTLLVLMLSTFIADAQKPDYSKLSTWVRHITYRQESGSGLQKQNKKVQDLLPQKDKNRLCAFVKTHDNSTNTLTEHGCKVLAKIGNVIIADIPISQIASLSNDKSIERIEANHGMTALMDTTVLLIGANHAHDGLNLPQAFTGKGVIIGVQDVGFDLTHPTFYSRDLTEYRIKTLWDQLSTDTVNSEMYVGQVYNGKNDLLKYAHSRDNLLITHGTHTSGTAAGSGYDSRYKGVAFESDICLVNNAVTTDLPLIDSVDVYKYTYATDVLGFKYIFDYADSVGKPCVISFSEGSHQDLRGDDLLYYEALNSLLTPGHIIVASAGNEGTQTSLVPKPSGTESAGTYIMSSSRNIIVTAETTDDINFRLLVYNNRELPDTLVVNSCDITSAEDSTYIASLQTSGGEYSIELHAFPSCYEPTKTAFDIIFTAPDIAGTNVPMWFEMEGEQADSRMLIVSGYFYNSKLKTRIGNAVNGNNIHSPSSAPAVICVGATSHRHVYYNYLGERLEPTTFIDGLRAPYSSMGPTIDGRIKPDVVAPGTNVIASYSSYYLEANPDAHDIESDVEHFDFNGRTYAWNANTGTSMSTPVVAGTIALWLQANPQLTTNDVMELLRKTCIHPEPSLTYPNNQYGHGAIDAYRGLLHILGLNPLLEINKLSDKQPKNIMFRLTDKKLFIEFNTPERQNLNNTPYLAELIIYSVGGEELMRKDIKDSSQPTDLSHLKPGIYAIQVNTYDKPSSGSTLIRI